MMDTKQLADLLAKYKAGHSEPYAELKRMAPDLADEVIRLTAKLNLAEAEIKQWRSALTAVMTADFKDWHESDPAEWPMLAAKVMAELRDREDFAYKCVDAADAEIAAAVLAERERCIKAAADVLQNRHDLYVRKIEDAFDVEREMLLGDLAEAMLWAKKRCDRRYPRRG
jgi:hypothetical protein